VASGLLTQSLILKMEAIRNSETSLTFDRLLHINLVNINFAVMTFLLRHPVGERQMYRFQDTTHDKMCTRGRV
jgi:hypothetical protein